MMTDITSNLENYLKDEALILFKESVDAGLSIKDCIFQVQNGVLPKVPKERNRFFIKFTYDNQLQVRHYLYFINRCPHSLVRLRLVSTNLKTEMHSFITR